MQDGECEDEDGRSEGSAVKGQQLEGSGVRGQSEEEHEGGRAPGQLSTRLRVDPSLLTPHTGHTGHSGHGSGWGVRRRVEGSGSGPGMPVLRLASCGCAGLLAVSMPIAVGVIFRYTFL
eukprot:1201798-Rhodomonas_salina.2